MRTNCHLLQLLLLLLLRLLLLNLLLLLQLLLLLLLMPLLLIVHNCARNCVHNARFNEHKTTFPSGAHSRTHRAMNFFSVCRLLVGRMRADEVET